MFGKRQAVTLDVGSGGVRRTLWSLIDPATPGCVTLLGEPGSGKTTLLRQTAQRLTQRFAVRRAGPVLVDLPTEPVPSKGLLLLDGLDRVVEGRDELARRIAAIRDRPVVVTARRRSDAIAGSSIVTMQAPTAEQARAIAGAHPGLNTDPLTLTLAARFPSATNVVELFAATLATDADAPAFDLMVRRSYGSEPRPFQWFRAARHIHRHGLESVLADHLDDEWWQDVVRWRAELGPVEAALRPADPVAALRPFLVTPAGTRLCRNPVTVGLYTLSRNEMSPSTEPVTGLWDAEAAGFVRWVNGVAAGPTFRLPTPAERPAAWARFTVTTQDLIDAVTADAEPMLGHLLTLGIRARAEVVRRLLDDAQELAQQVVDGLRSRFRTQQAAKLAVAENRLADLRRMSPKELGLGIMQVNAERRAVAQAIDELRAASPLPDDPAWAWANRVAEAVDRCRAQAADLYAGLAPRTALSDVDIGLRIDRHLDALHLTCADLNRALDPEPLMGAGARAAERTMRRAMEAARSVSAGLGSAPPPGRLVAVQPLLGAVAWQGRPDPYDPARSAAGVLRGALGPSFAAAMARMLGAPVVSASHEPSRASGPGAPDAAGGHAHGAAGGHAQGAAARCRAFAVGLVTAAAFPPVAFPSAASPDAASLPVASAPAASRGAASRGADPATASPERFEVRLSECAAAVADLLTRPTRNHLRQRLLRAAGPIFDRSAEPDPQSLATIRFYALVLAGGRSADLMRHLAAATVVLARPAEETLLLVID